MKIRIKRDSEREPRRRDLLILPVERTLRRFARGVRQVLITLREDGGGAQGRSQVVCDVSVEEEDGRRHDISRRATREPQALDRALRDLAEDLDQED